MSFHLPVALLRNQMVCGTRVGTSKSNRQFLSMTLVDDNGITNEVSTSDPDIIAYCQTLRQGDHVDLSVLAHGDRERQYLMISKVPNPVTLTDPSGY